MNLERRIKRHVIGPRHSLYAVTLPGCEFVCKSEIGRLSDTITLDRKSRGGVSFSGRLVDVYRANLQVRTAGRILIRIASFRATNFHQLEKKTAEIAWSLWLPAGAVPECFVSAHRSRLRHTKAIAERITGRVAAHWVDLGVSPAETRQQALYVRLSRDQAELSLDSSGANLYRRGLKTHEARAPLRETTAAAILKQAGYRPDMPLIDPMCGSGTFSLEAALMAKHMAPGLQRSFAFMQWPAFKPRQWAHLTRMAAEKIEAVSRPLIWASDTNADACGRLAATSEQFQLSDAVRVSRGDFFDLDPRNCTSLPGLIVLNPPYGRRLKAQAEIGPFYQRIAAKLKNDFKGWRAALIAPPDVQVHKLNLKLKQAPLHHGGLKLVLLTGTIR